MRWSLLGGQVCTIWVVATWLMHVGIYLTMAVGFPAPLFGLAFAPFFALERIPGRYGRFSRVSLNARTSPIAA
ncbi:MAG: hypothetical protein R2715_21130 [Ilumatobacteraceae bacterium]